MATVRNFYIWKNLTQYESVQTMNRTGCFHCITNNVSVLLSSMFITTEDVRSSYLPFRNKKLWKGLNIRARLPSLLSVHKPSRPREPDTCHRPNMMRNLSPLWALWKPNGTPALAQCQADSVTAAHASSAYWPVFIHRSYTKREMIVANPIAFTGSTFQVWQYSAEYPRYRADYHTRQRR
jgi:hypothetical protein